MSAGKILAGVLAGFAAGAILGVLFAPEKGSVTRRRISEMGGDYLDTLKESLGSTAEDIRDQVDEVKNEVRETASRVRGKVREVSGDDMPDHLNRPQTPNV